MARRCILSQRPWHASRLAGMQKKSARSGPLSSRQPSLIFAFTPLLDWLADTNNSPSFGSKINAALTLSRRRCRRNYYYHHYFLPLLYYLIRLPTNETKRNEKIDAWQDFRLRIGIAIGPVIAGVVGKSFSSHQALTLSSTYMRHQFSASKLF